MTIPLEALIAEGQKEFKARFIEFRDDYRAHLVEYKGYERDMPNSAEDVMAWVVERDAKLFSAGVEAGIVKAIFVAKGADPQYGKKVGQTYWGRVLHAALFELLDKARTKDGENGG